MKNLSALNALIRKNWRYLLQIGAWLMAVLASFVLPPPLWDLRQHPVWFRFSHFLVSALVGLMFIPMSAWSAKRHRRGWAIVSASALAVGVALFFGYQALRDSWTTAYAGGRIVVGETYTGDALAYKAKVFAEEKRVIPDDELVMDSAGKTETIWAVGELRRRALIIAGVYVATIVFFALGVITLVQALYCNSKKSRAFGGA